MPPIGGRNTLQVRPRHELRDTCRRSARTACGAARLRLTPKRSATPGRYQTGSIATLVTATSPVSCRIVAVDLEPAGRHRVVHLGHGEPRLGDRDASGGCRRPRRSRRRSPRATRWPHGSSETMLSGLRPLRERADLDDGRGVGEVRPRDRVQRAGRDRERAIERIGAAMRADDVAVAPGFTVPTTGPRSRAVAAPQRIGKRVATPPRPGCEVRRICARYGCCHVVIVAHGLAGNRFPLSGAMRAPKAINLPRDTDCRTRGLPSLKRIWARKAEKSSFCGGNQGRRELADFGRRTARLVERRADAVARGAGLRIRLDVVDPDAADREQQAFAGNTARQALNTAGGMISAGNSFSPSAPAFSAAKPSDGVMTPGSAVSSPPSRRAPHPRRSSARR